MQIADTSMPLFAPPLAVAASTVTVNPTSAAVYYSIAINATVPVFAEAQRDEASRCKRELDQMQTAGELQQALKRAKLLGDEAAATFLCLGLPPVGGK